MMGQQEHLGTDILLPLCQSALRIFSDIAGKKKVFTVAHQPHDQTPVVFAGHCAIHVYIPHIIETGLSVAEKGFSAARNMDSRALGSGQIQQSGIAAARGIITVHPKGLRPESSDEKIQAVIMVRIRMGDDQGVQMADPSVPEIGGNDPFSDVKS